MRKNLYEKILCRTAFVVQGKPYGGAPDVLHLLKGDKMEKKTIEEYPFTWVEKRVKSKKPIRNEKGGMRYKDALVYLVRVLKQDQPDFNLILGLASFATANGLSEKQAAKASEIIKFYEKEGIL